MVQDFIKLQITARINYIDGRSQIKVHTVERTQVHSDQSSLTVTHPSTNRGRRCLASMNVPLHELVLIALILLLLDLGLVSVLVRSLSRTTRFRLHH